MHEKNCTRKYLRILPDLQNSQTFSSTNDSYFTVYHDVHQNLHTYLIKTFQQCFDKQLETTALYIGTPNMISIVAFNTYTNYFQLFTKVYS